MVRKPELEETPIIENHVLVGVLYILPDNSQAIIGIIIQKDQKKQPNRCKCLHTSRDKT